MKKRIISFLLAVMMVVSLVPATVFATETEVVAKIGETSYETLAAAVDAVPTDMTETTIKLLGDTTGSGVKVVAGQNIVFDLDNHTYTVVDPTVGSTGTETNAFQMLKGSKVTFKNGALESAVAKIFLQNYCDLTLDGVTVNAQKNAQIQYAVSNNFGSLTTKGNTKIYGSDGQVAFDIWYGMNSNGLYDDGVTVTLGKGTLVDGTIEIGAASRAANENMAGKIKLNGLNEATLANNTIKLTSNVWFNGLKIGEGQTVAFDLNNKTLNIANSTVGSTGTETNGFQLLKNATVSFKDGTVTSSVAKILIQNYSNLTLNNVTLDGTNLQGNVPYTLSTNNGATTIEDTTIVGHTNGYAFDVCSFGSYTSNAVTVTGNSVITGKIELSRTNTALLTLALEGGNFENAEIVVSAGGEAAAVTKAASVTLAAPTGYEWSNDGRMVQKAAATNVAKIGETEYATLQAAVDAATAGQTITLLADYVATNSVVIDKNVALDLNGKKVTVDSAWAGVSPTSQALLYVKSGAKLTVNDTVGGGMLDSSANEAVYGAVCLTIKDQNDETKNAEFVMNGGTLKGYYYGIVCNGTRHNTKITVNGGVITSGNAQDGTSIYHPGKGELTINGGEFVGYDGLQVKGGTVVINGGTFRATGEYKPAENAQTSGSNSVGAALYVEGNYKFAASVTVNGGSFETTDTQAPAVFMAFNEAPQAKISISGGSFSSDPSAYLATGFAATQSGSVWTVVLAEKHVDVVVEANADKGITTEIAQAVSSNAAVNNMTAAQTHLNTAVNTADVNVKESLAWAIARDNTDVSEAAAKAALDTLTIGMKVELSSANATAKTLTYDVKPVASVTIGGETYSANVPNEKLSDSVTFRLPVPAGFGDYAKVVHKSTGMADEVSYAKVQEGNYVELTVTHFSKFTVEPASEGPKVANVTGSALVLSGRIVELFSVNVPAGSAPQFEVKQHVGDKFADVACDSVRIGTANNISTYYVYVPVAAKEAHDDLYLRVYTKNGDNDPAEYWQMQSDGENLGTMGYSDCVMRYVDYVITKEGKLPGEAKDTELLELCKALKYYCYAAQIQFAYGDHTALSNDQSYTDYIDDIDLSDFNPESYKADVKGDAMWYGSSLLLQDGTDILHYFVMPSHTEFEADNVTVTVDGIPVDRVNAMTGKIDDGQPVWGLSSKQQYLMVQIPGCAANKLGVKSTVVVKVAQGSSELKITLKYSALSYVQACGYTDTTMALVNYGNCAVDYFGE